MDKEEIIQDIFTSIWGNGAEIKIVTYKEAPEGYNENDVIQILFNPDGEKQKGFMVTTEEANQIIYGLSRAIIHKEASDDFKISNF